MAKDGEEDETTYIMVKPDGVQRGLVGEIIGRFERKGLKLVGLKSMVPRRNRSTALRCSQGATVFPWIDQVRYLRSSCLHGMGRS